MRRPISNRLKTRFRGNGAVGRARSEQARPTRREGQLTDPLTVSCYEVRPLHVLSVEVAVGTDNFDVKKTFKCSLFGAQTKPRFENRRSSQTFLSVGDCPASLEFPRTFERSFRFAARRDSATNGNSDGENRPRVSRGRLENIDPLLLTGNDRGASSKSHYIKLKLLKHQCSKFACSISCRQIRNVCQAPLEIFFFP